MSKERFRVLHVFHIDGVKEATITIDRERGVAECRPLRRQQVYRATLAQIAEFIAWHDAKKQVQK